MATQVTNYQCPACTGPLHFEGTTGKLQCEYCGSAYAVEEIEAMYADKEEKAQENFQQAQEKASEKAQQAPGEEDSWVMESGQWSPEEAAGMRAYSCPSCGAEIICDQNTAATSCLYCGNPTVVPGQFSGALKPDYIIPFKLEKEQAIKNLKKYYKGKRFLPKAFTSGNHIEELQGVYVPFWLYDGSANGFAAYDGTRSRSHVEGDYRVTETDHFLAERSGVLEFKRVPVDGSTKMPDAHMDAIEPFDYNELKPFSTAYLPGKLADKYDQSAEQCKDRAVSRVKNSTEEMLRETVTGYEAVHKTRFDANVTQGQVKYAMLPVWMLHTKWKDKSYLFAMNGQTGKLIGDLPVSKGKFAAWMAGIAAPLTAILAIWLLIP